MNKRKNPLREIGRALTDGIDQVLDLLPTPESRSDPSDSNPENFLGKWIECFLCGRKVELKLTKKGRPFYQCLDCWCQVFVRGDAGIRRLAKKLREDSTS